MHGERNSKVRSYNTSYCLMMGISHFHLFFLKPQNRFEPNLAEMFIGWSYTKFLILALIGNPRCEDTNVVIRKIQHNTVNLRQTTKSKRPNNDLHRKLKIGQHKPQ